MLPVQYAQKGDIFVEDRSDRTISLNVQPCELSAGLLAGGGTPFAAEGKRLHSAGL